STGSNRIARGASGWNVERGRVPGRPAVNAGPVTRRASLMMVSAPSTARAGTAAVIRLFVAARTFPETPPNNTRVAVASVVNPVPSIVTTVPGPPVSGATEVIVSAF